MNWFLLGTHYLVFFVAVLLSYTSERIARHNLILVLGFLGVPLFGLLTLILLDFSNHAGNGTTGAWYLIFSVVTLGGVPVVTHLCAAVSGVCAYRFRAWIGGFWSEASA